MQKELQLLGLTPNEAVVYEAVVNAGTCKAGQLIAKLDMHRNIIYRTLESLVVNGYVTKIIRNGVWYFQISDPQSFLISMNRKELVLGELLKEIDERQNRVSSQIVVYEGIASYRNYWMRSLERIPDGTIDYVAGSDIKKWDVLMGKKYIDEYTREAKRKGMSWKTLYFNVLEKDELEMLKQAEVPTECRQWEPGAANFLGNFNVIADTVILHTPSEKTPRVIEMRDKVLVEMFQNMFNLMWEQARPIDLSVSAKAD